MDGSDYKQSMDAGLYNQTEVEDLRLPMSKRPKTSSIEEAEELNETEESELNAHSYVPQVSTGDTDEETLETS